MKLPMTLRLLLCLCAVAACDDLPKLDADTCGNLVAEAPEQCDGEPGCGAEGVAACRFVCERGVSACPGDLACSTDGLCAAPTGRFVPFELAPTYAMPADRIEIGDLDGDGASDVIGLAEALRVRFGSRFEPLRDTYEKRIRPATGQPAFGELDDRPGLDVVFPTADGVFTLTARGRELEAVPYASGLPLPDDSARACVGSPGWARCRTIDLDRDGRLDRIGFVAERNNLEVELGRGAGPAIAVTLPTLDVVTHLTAGDLDGDGFGDVAYATRAGVGPGAATTVRVVYGAPQPVAFVTATVATGGPIAELAAAEVSTPADGLDDLGVARVGGGVALYLGDSARDLSAPFALAGGRAGLDVPYAVVAGEFVDGRDSGIDVMAYARNPAAPGRTFLWWLRGSGNARLELGIVDEIASTDVELLDTSWAVGDLVADHSTQDNGPDEVIGLATTAPGCSGPALTAAVPSARGTGTQLVRSACLQVEGAGWRPSLVGLVYASTSAVARAVVVAHRDPAWWIGEADRLDDATAANQLAGNSTPLAGACRDPQLWSQLPETATFVSVVCEEAGASTATIVGLRQAPGGAPTTQAVLVAIPAGATHHAGDFNGDGLTDLLVRRDHLLTVMLQCSTDLAGVAGC